MHANVVTFSQVQERSEWRPGVKNVRAFEPRSEMNTTSDAVQVLTVDPTLSSSARRDVTDPGPSMHEAGSDPGSVQGADSQAPPGGE